MTEEDKKLSNMGRPVKLDDLQQHKVGLDRPAREAIDTIRLLAPQCGYTEPMTTKNDVIRFALKYVADALQDFDHDPDDEIPF